ncbi:MAG: hypothetical protein WCJ56_16320, partial [bacterium]
GTIPAGTTCSEVVAGMDFLPTFAALAGTVPPSDRIIDGRDISPLMRGEADAVSPHEQFIYTHQASIDAVRVGKWKLFAGRLNNETKQYEQICELYNLEEDITETTNMASLNPDIVSDLQARILAAREDLGDVNQGIAGKNVRPIGTVEHPDTLTHRDLSNPYIIAAYDVEEHAVRAEMANVNS